MPRARSVRFTSARFSLFGPSAKRKRREKWFYMLLNVFKCFLMFCFDALLDRKKVKTSWFLFGACDRGLERILDPHDFVEYITYFILQDMQFS